MPNLPFVSIIIVNYNTAQHIIDLLDSLLLSSYTNYEVIIVDNASKQDDFTALLAHPIPVQLIYSAENLGFAGGNNIGIEAANGDYLLFLNPDVVVCPNLIKELLRPFKANAKVGMVSPKIKYYHQPEIIQYAGFSAMSTFTMRTKAYGKGKKDGIRYNYAQITHFGHGAAMMVSRTVIEQVGGMSTEYFLYYEELDWSERIRKAGFLIYYAPDSVVLHKESVTTEKQSPLKLYYMTRNRYLFARKHYRSWQLAFFTLYNLLVLLPKNVSKYIRQPLLLRAYLNGLKWHLPFKVC